MEGEVCQYFKFGFCKFKSKCKRIHFTEECQNNSTCEGKSTCQKRHPKNCKRYTSGNCSFKVDCAYKHQSNIAVLDHSNIEQKVKFLENFVHELSLKLLNMEEELQALKQTKVGENSKVETKYFTEELEKAETYIDEELEYSKEEETEVFPEIDLSHISGKKEGSENKEAIKNKSGEDKFLFCEYCSYKCKKESTLQKHKNDKHALNDEGHQCNQCIERFPSLSDLLEHDEKEHRGKYVQKSTSFVFSDTMLDEFEV